MKALITVGVIAALLYIYYQRSQSASEPFSIRSIDDFARLPSYSKGRYLRRLHDNVRYPHRINDEADTIYSEYIDDNNYLNLTLPVWAIGGGRRRAPTFGGSQIVIPNTRPPIDISNNNIAPTNIRVKCPAGQVVQVGVVYQIFGADNYKHPLYGVYTPPNKWKYFTTVDGTKREIIHNRPFELGNNDEVEIQGISGKYRTTIYDSDILDYTTQVDSDKVH